MAQHKWAKEIIHWANGGEIEYRSKDLIDGDVVWGCWQDCGDNTHMPAFFADDDFEYRIKPQPKEPQYLNVYGWLENENICFNKSSDYPYIGKIKLEQDDD